MHQTLKYAPPESRHQRELPEIRRRDSLLIAILAGKRHLRRRLFQFGCVEEVVVSWEVLAERFQDETAVVSQSRKILKRTLCVKSDFHKNR